MEFKPEVLEGNSHYAKVRRILDRKFGIKELFSPRHSILNS
jgi:hypothetical protein